MLELYYDDYISYICSFLTIRDIANFRLISSRFNNISVKKINKINTNVLSKEIINDDVLLNHKSFFSNITEFYYFGNPTLTIKGMKVLSNLKELNFACGDKEVPNFSELTTIEEIILCAGGANKLYYDKIKHLDLKKFHMHHGYIYEEDKLFHHKFKNLVELTLLFNPDEMSYQTQNDYVQLISKTLKLKYLKLKTQYNIDLNNFTTLEQLNISSSGIRHNSIEKLSQLKMLNIKRNEISCINNLTNLEIYHGNCIDFTNQSKLKNVYLYGRVNQADELMCTLKTSAQSIQILQIYCNDTDVVDCDTIGNMINLIDLSVLFPKTLTKLNVSKLTKLKYINVHNILLKGTLSESLKKIKVIISKDHKISNKLIFSNCNNLEKMCIQGNSIENLGNKLKKFKNDNKLTKKDILVLKNNKDLTYLSISNESNIAGSIINNNFYNLTTLKINGISSKIESLNNLNKLRVLNLIACQLEPDCIASLELIELLLSSINVHVNINPTKLKKLDVHNSPNQKIILKDLVAIKEICCRIKWAKNNLKGFNELSDQERKKIFPSLSLFPELFDNELYLSTGSVIGNL